MGPPFPEGSLFPIVTNCLCLPGGLSCPLFTLAGEFLPGLPRYAATVAVKRNGHPTTAARGLSTSRVV
jgi:hypothetical protein